MILFDKFKVRITMNPIDNDTFKVLENIPVEKSFLYRAKEYLYYVCQSDFIIRIFSILPWPLLKYSDLANLIIKTNEVFSSRTINLEASLFGGDKLETLQKEIKAILEDGEVSVLNYQTQFVIENKDCIGAAKSLVNDSDDNVVAIHNLANRVQFGGVGRAPFSGSQEEYMIRRSNLYWSLSFDYNQNLKNAFLEKREEEGYEKELPEHHIPYFGSVISKDVSFLDSSGQEDFSCAVISNASPDLRQNFFFKSDEANYFQKTFPEPSLRKDAIREVVRHKITAVLGACLKEGVTHPVLGAAGCGAFKNDPQMVAEEFNNLFENEFKNKFKKVTFAILESNKTPIGDIFRKALHIS